MSFLGDAVPMDARLDQAPIVARFAHDVRDLANVVGFYAGGSLAMGDFRPGISDLDLAAVVDRPLDGQRRKRVRELHETVRRADPSAAKLHCVYLLLDDLRLDDTADRRMGHLGDMAALRTPHLTWTHGKFYRRPFTGVARAELLQAGITVFGPLPADVLAPIDSAMLQAAARAELSGFWSSAVRKPWLWFEDLYVDLGLLTLARVEATLGDGRLITKREALARLDRFGVPAELVREIASRRDGAVVGLTTVERIRRATMARRLMSDGIRSLT
jgi:Nucleotidyltransferase domain